MTIKYPDRYSLKTDSDRIDEASKLANLIFSVPTKEGKKEVYKLIISTLLGGRVNIERIDKIHAEIDKNDYLTSDPDTIIAATEAFICDPDTAADALGFAAGTAEKAQKHRKAVAEEVAKAQGIAKGSGDPAARGVPELSANPRAGSQEKSGKPKRGNGRNSRASGSGE